MQFTDSSRNLPPSSLSTLQSRGLKTKMIDDGSLPRTRNLSIQIHESEGSAEYLRITPERFELALNQHSALEALSSAPFSRSSAGPVPSLATAGVLVLGHAKFQELFPHPPHMKAGKAPF